MYLFGFKGENQYFVIENADATPPHLDVFLVLWKLQQLAWVIEVYMQNIATRIPLGQLSNPN